MKKITLRHVKKTDYEDIVSLWRLHWPPNQMEKDLINKIRNDRKHVLVAIDRGRIVGTIIGGNDYWRQWIYHVAVDPEYEEKEIPWMLFEKMHEVFSGEGTKEVRLFTFKNNETMKKDLEKMGYRTRPEVMCSKKI